MSSLCHLVWYVNWFCCLYAENDLIDTLVDKALREVYPVQPGEGESFVVAIVCMVNKLSIF